MSKNTKAVWIGLAAVVAAAALIPLSCGSPKDPWEGIAGPPRVVATFPPLDCFVQNVGGPDVGVLTLCTTTGPHEFEPTVEDKQKLEKADLFLLNGLGLEDQFAAGMAQTSKNPRLRDEGTSGMIDLGARLLKAGLVDKFQDHDERDHDKHKEAGKHEEAHGHDEHQHGEYDPHVWLGIPQAVRMVEIIRDELKSADPAHAEGYDRRAAEYIARLRKLHADGKAELADKKNRKIVTSHDSLHYFAKSFDIDVEDVIQLQPGSDPDPATLADIVKKCKEEGVRVIATEPQYDSKTAQTLLKELHSKGVSDVELIQLDPLETLSGGEKLDAGWYERRMRANLDELKKALR
jgi:ABC-type Zn uptake system ZnuABC Zn-binding protein ZnuA